MWGSFSADSVFGFCFEPDRQYHFLDTPGFYSTLNEATAGMSEPLHWMLHMPLVRKALMSLPGGLVKAMDEKMGSFVEFKEVGQSEYLPLFMKSFLLVLRNSIGKSPSFYKLVAKEKRRATHCSARSVTKAYPQKS